MSQFRENPPKNSDSHNAEEKSDSVISSIDSPLESQSIESLCKLISSGELQRFQTLALQTSTINFDTAKNQVGSTLLIWAIIENQAPFVAFMIQKSLCNVNEADDDGNSPLQVAVCHLRADIVQMLLSCEDINLNQVDSEGSTPLHDACQNGSCEIIRMLVEAGSDCSIRNLNGLRAKEVCSDSNTLQCLASSMARVTSQKNSAPHPCHSPASSSYSSHHHNRSISSVDGESGTISSSAPSFFGRKRNSPLNSDDAMRKSLLLSRRPHQNNSPKKRRRYSCSALKLSALKKTTDSREQDATSSSYNSVTSNDTLSSLSFPHNHTMEWGENSAASEVVSLEDEEMSPLGAYDYTSGVALPQKVRNEVLLLRLDNKRLKTENTSLRKDIALEREKVLRLEAELKNRKLMVEIAQVRRENDLLKKQQEGIDEG